MNNKKSKSVRNVIRDLAKRYRDICASERNIQAIKLWRNHNSLIKTRPPVICSCFFASSIQEEIDAAIPSLMASEEPFKTLEYWLRTRLWASTIPDDTVYYPWYVMRAEMQWCPPDVWGVELNRIYDEDSRGWRCMPVLKNLEDIQKLKATPHVLINENTPKIQAVRELIGDILPIHVDKSTVYPIWSGTDLSDTAGKLLGLEELMYALYENPTLVHRLMAFMRDAVLANLKQGEAAGDWSSVEHQNYGMPPHTTGFPEPKDNSHGAKLKDLWFFTHAQEFESVSPAQHEEFLLQYQMPIMEKFGLVNYGCCETLHNKIDMLRKIPNLRRILMGPRADLRKGCAQIGRDYIVSWRPSPVMVSSGFDEKNIHNIIRQGLKDSMNCNIEIMLKEILTVENNLSRLFKWTKIARQEAEALG